MSTIFSYYISRHFLISFLAVFGIFLGLIFLFDVIELLRRASGHDDIGLPTVLQMGLLKLPFLGQQAFPFAVLFGSMVAFWRLTLNSELIVARAAGVSAWQILIPVLGVSLLLGLLQVGALNPLASAFFANRLCVLLVRAHTPDSPPSRTPPPPSSPAPAGTRPDAPSTPS